MKSRWRLKFFSSLIHQLSAHQKRSLPFFSFSLCLRSPSHFFSTVTIKQTHPPNPLPAREELDRHVPPRGPVPRELHEAKGAAGQVLDLHVLLVVGQGIAPDARGCHRNVCKDAWASLWRVERKRRRERRRTRASARVREASNVGVGVRSGCDFFFRRRPPLASLFFFSLLDA